MVRTRSPAVRFSIPFSPSAVRMRLRHFLRYLERNRDDSPLYIFDATFDEARFRVCFRC